MLEPIFTTSVQNEKADYAKLVIEPLKQGYGHTFGNALRRVLLGALSGAAITNIKIKGVRHQFSTLEGMDQDIVQLILNLKTLRFKLDNIDKETLKLEVSGPKEVKAKDIALPVGVTISNPDTYLCNLADKKASLSVEITVETGQGYSPAEERKSDRLGIIPVDALFSPIKRVNHTIENTRVGRRTDFDKLILEIWTDGTITPQDALVKAAQILVEHFNQIINPVEIAKLETETEPSYKANETLNLTVEELDLPTRIANALRKGGYKTVKNLTEATEEEIIKVKNLGGRSITLVQEALEKKGVSLKQV